LWLEEVTFFGLK